MNVTLGPVLVGIFMVQLERTILPTLREHMSAWKSDARMFFRNLCFPQYSICSSGSITQRAFFFSLHVSFYLVPKCTFQLK